MTHAAGELAGHREEIPFGNNDQGLRRCNNSPRTDARREAGVGRVRDDVEVDADAADNDDTGAVNPSPDSDAGRPMVQAAARHRRFG